MRPLPKDTGREEGREEAIAGHGHLEFGGLGGGGSTTQSVYVTTMGSGGWRGVHNPDPLRAQVWRRHNWTGKASIFPAVGNTRRSTRLVCT